MLVATIICIAMTRFTNPPADCAGLDSATASQSERRSAIDACAAEAKQNPLDFFLGRVEQLRLHDSRSDSYGDLIAAWNPDELSQTSIVAKLFAVYKNEATSADARVVALRAITALPMDKRPADLLPI